MTQTTLLVALAAILTGGILLYNTQRHASSADDRLEQQQYKSLARDAAEAGLNVVVRALANTNAMGSWNNDDFDIGVTSYHGGTFEVDVQMADGTGDLVDVVVTATNGPGEATIFARYEREKDDVGVPPAFRNVITTQGNITLGGTLLIDSVDDSWNASIHTNSILNAGNANYVVEGYGTFWDDGNVHRNAYDNFRPNVDYNSPECPTPPGNCGLANNVFQADAPIEIPAVDGEGFRQAALTSGAIRMGDLAPGNNQVIDFTNPSSPFWAANGLTYTCANSPCGTAENPFVLYVSGRATFGGTTQVLGYGTIYVNGIATIGGMYGELNDDMETQVLLATNSNLVSVGNNQCFGLGPASYTRHGLNNQNSHCQSTDGSFTHGLSMYASGTFDFGGGPFMVGGIVSPGGEFGGLGNAWIAYAGASESILDPGFEYIVPIGPILVAYSEW